MNHEDLCERARRWLAGNRRCEPVFSNIASCAEIPDAIGWSSSYKHRGSIVVEAKCSVSDFHADRKKYIAWKDPEFNFTYPGSRVSQKEATERGYALIPLAAMGDYRFFICEDGVISLDLVEKHRPDHGLLYVRGRKTVVVREAPRRELVDKDGEIRYLRFAIINGKEPYAPCEEGRVDLFSQTGQAEARVGRDPQQTSPEATSA